MNACTPDLVLLVGDYMNTTPIGGGRVPPERIGEILSALEATLGRFAVLGNHDHEFGGERVARTLEAAGLAFVDNSVTFIDVAGTRLRLVGLADATSVQPDLRIIP